MKQAILLLFVFTIASLGIGCGGTAEKTAGANKAGGSNNSPAANSAVVVDANANPPSESEPPAGNIANANTKRPVIDTSGSVPPPSFKPAGEDSQIAVSMRPDGKILEVRVFKSHPQLARVESVWDGQGEKELKFVLKNGKVIAKKSDRIENLQTAPTAVLVEIAGIPKPPPPPATSSRTTKAPDKKPEQ
jgi:hypothetical protein